GDPGQWRAAVRAAVAQVAPDQPISDFRSMDRIVRSTTAATHRTLLLVGVAIVLGMSRLLEQLLVSLAGRGDTFDPVALGGACTVLAIAGLLACFLPALRAARVPPMRALRGE
ncbi:MAG: hypothetical protein KGI63_10315, partial [Xanthomonadaceae bacterium]|nr:hypothetical protein [Xanthomonadaceae bacterium]